MPRLIRHTAVFMFLLLFSQTPFQLAAQNDLSYLPEGLHKMRPEELKEIPMTLSKLPHYLDGKKVSKRQLNKLLMNPNYSADLYGDSRGKIKAVVIRKSTAEERKAKMALVPGPRNSPDWIDREMPPFEATDLAGNPIDADNLKGKVVVINFWYIGCKPCILEMPEMNRMVRQFDPEEVVFLAFGLDTKEDIQAFLKRKPFKYTIIPRARPFTTRFGIVGYPTHMVVDQSGKVQYHQIGYNRTVVGTIQKEISRLLKD